MGYSSGSAPADLTRAYAPTGVTIENTPRIGQANATATALVSGTLRLTAIYLPSSFTVTSISFMSAGALTLGTSPHFWVALFTGARVLCSQSTDNTAAAWGANTLLTTNLASTYTTTTTGLYYAGVMCSMTGGTQPTVVGATGTATLVGLAPILTGTSTTGLTDTAPDPAASLTGATVIPWAGVA